MAAAKAIVVAVFLPLVGIFTFALFVFPVAAARLRGRRGLAAGAAGDGGKKERDEEVDENESDDDDTRATFDRLTRG